MHRECYYTFIDQGNKGVSSTLDEAPFCFGKGDIMAAFDKVKSGIPEMDKALDHIRLGDNVVWRVSELAEFKLFMEPYIRQAVLDKRRIVYFRFASHDALVDDCPEIMTVHNCYSVHHEEYAPFEDNRWEKISSEYEHICICSGFLDIYSDYDVKDHCLDLELFAYRNDMTINVSFYARDNYSESVEADVEAMFASGELPEDTLFVFLDGEERPDTDLNYYELDGILIGLKETL